MYIYTMEYIYLYLYKIEYYSAIKMNEILPFAITLIDLEGITLSEVRQRKTNTVYQLYVESKIWHKWTYLWNRNIITDIENRGGWGRDEVGGWS